MYVRMLHDMVDEDTGSKFDMMDALLLGVKTKPYESLCAFAGGDSDETLSWSGSGPYTWDCNVWWSASKLRERWMRFAIKTTAAVTITLTWYGNEVPNYESNGAAAGKYDTASTISTASNSWVSVLIPVPIAYPYISFKLSADSNPGTTVARIWGYGIS